VTWPVERLLGVITHCTDIMPSLPWASSAARRTRCCAAAVGPAQARPVVVSSSSLQTQLELAIGLLLKLFEHRDRVAIAAAEEIGLSRRTLQRAARELGIRKVHRAGTRCCL